MTRTVATATFDVQEDWSNSWYERYDINNDGRQDLVFYANSVRAFSDSLVEQPSAFLKVFIQNADGSLSDRSTDYIRNPISTLLGVDPALGDFNGDGRLDVVLAGSGWDPYTDGRPAPIEFEKGEPDVLYLSNPDGTWTATTPVALNVWSHTVTVGDLNKDGLDDVFSSSIEDAPSTDRSFLTISGNGGSYSYDQNRLPNILTDPDYVSQPGQRPTYVNEQGLTVFTHSTFLGATLFDANGDGHLDLAVFANSGTKSNLLFLNDGTGAFTDGSEIELPRPIFGYGGWDTENKNAGTNNLDGRSLDIDNDGDLDLVVLATLSDDRSDERLFYAGTGIQVLINDGNANFSISQELKVAENVDLTYSHDLDLYDINRDGQLDVIAQGYHFDQNHYRTEVFLNQGGSLVRATGDYIPEKTKMYIPFHQDGQLHFYSYNTTPYALDPRDGLALSNATFETIISNAGSGTVIATNDEAENLLGSNGNDTFLASGGSDFIDAMGGNDLVRYDGARSDYRISIDGQTITVLGTARLDGRDTLVNVETVEFADATVRITDNIIDGTDGVDALIGTSSIDLMSAFSGNDTITGGSGNDIIDGGAGLDTATFSGARSDYAVFTGANGLVYAADANSARDGKDTLQNVEFISFAGATVTVSEALVEPVDADGSAYQIYRFFNSSSGSHFFTTSLAERNSIIENLDGLSYEGNVFDSNVTEANGSAVYRFYNTETGVHFYTASSAEADYIRQNLSSFNDEGVSYYAATDDSIGGTALYRFFNTSNGSHFFTTSEAERDNIIGTLGQYNYEGIAYYVDVA